MLINGYMISIFVIGDQWLCGWWSKVMWLAINMWWILYYNYHLFESGSFLGH